ncbi:PREDICTED: multiple coagulation factor deficiency protein 2 homolog [Dufourea novaeangliae]|uniref:Multiple coagulation factor deficiency protein 2 like protein n=1 Tax=Dufourea novaeangliae TaxID=178035 RepID=A0A154PNU4_DUFNO|nr:PREDICTED: multiple coagulation factor deficiency protein 2 homolog [Dufourea novaeangliae]KZC13522.1 Multiple coagulation factor deficiency protein 2 like protein [Dufourea novaeangliae]
MNWTLWLFILGSFSCNHIYVQAQRVPPGVSPQHYQQPVQQVHQVPQQIPQQQFQQPQGQVPMHQVPVQQVPVQQHMPTHQIPVQQGHAHDHSQQILNAANIVNEKAHIAEHMEVPIDTSKMTDQELQFHYFKMHDADNNNKLDGCELIKSLIHWHEQGKNEVGVKPEEKLFKDEELVTLIDPILSMDDTNNDGYIDYPEFIQAQQNAAATGRQ